MNSRKLENEWADDMPLYSIGFGYFTECFYIHMYMKGDF